MSADKPSYSNTAGRRTYSVGLTGTGAADPVKRYGNNVTVTWTATGVYKFAFAAHPGNLLGFRAQFGADTPGDVKGQTCTRSTYTAPSGSTPGFLSLSVWSSGFAADDLQLLEYLDIEFEFSELSLS